MQSSISLLSVAAIALTLGLAQAVAEENEEDAGPSPFDILLGESERCINLNRIDRTEVIDDRTIVFYLSGGDIYVNRLPHRCPGLRSRDGFMYKRTTNSLCNVDTIRVLDSMGGELRPGVGCGLGEFHPVSAGTLDELKAIDDR
jgi:hypothetical protein